MLFNSVDYFLFFIVVFAINYILPKRIRYIWLVFASYYFYGCWNVKYTLLIFFITAISYVASYLIEIVKKSVNTEDYINHVTKTILAFAIVMCFGCLVYFKYANFIISNINSILNITSKNIKLSLINVILPVGISFYTFQAVGYIIDVYKGKVIAERNVLRYALFISFFPQLVAGPIERSTNLLHQLRNPNSLTEDRIREGVFLLLFGLWQKLFVADRVAKYVDEVFGNYNEYTGIELAIAVMLFGIQIYCDFSGYSNMAIGSAKLFGIDLMNNFNAPYLAKSVVDFWRRWHISLTSWFTDYLYIPLGGNRKGSIRKYINVLIVFMVSGLWHGASWNFVFWGFLNGIMNIISGILQKRAKEDTISKVEGLFRTTTTFLLIDFCWLFFRAESLGMAFSIIRKGIGYWGIGPFLRGESFDKLFSNSINLFLVIVAMVLLFAFDAIQNKTKSLFLYVSSQKAVYRWSIYLCMVLLIVVFGAYGEGYEQSNFIYFQF